LIISDNASHGPGPQRSAETYAARDQPYPLLSKTKQTLVRNPNFRPRLRFGPRLELLSSGSPTDDLPDARFFLEKKPQPSLYPGIQDIVLYVIRGVRVYRIESWGNTIKHRSYGLLTTGSQSFASPTRTDSEKNSVDQLGFHRQFTACLPDCDAFEAISSEKKDSPFGKPPVTLPTRLLIGGSWPLHGRFLRVAGKGSSCSLGKHVSHRSVYYQNPSRALLDGVVRTRLNARGIVFSPPWRVLRDISASILAARALFTWSARLACGGTPAALGSNITAG